MKINYVTTSNEELKKLAIERALLKEGDEFKRNDVIELLKLWDNEHPETLKQYEVLNSKGEHYATIGEESLEGAKADPNLKQIKDDQDNIVKFQIIKDDDDDDDELEGEYKFEGKPVTKEKYHKLKRAGLIKE